jgi:hypothetical protein
MVNCRYNENNKYYNIYFRNKINVNELMNITRKYTSFTGNHNIKILADFRKSNIDISELEIDIFREKIMKYNSEVTIRAAIIQEDPILTAYTILFLDNLNQPKVNIKLFSTNEAAEDWLLKFE